MALSYVYMEGNDMLELILQWMTDCFNRNYHGLRQWSNDFGRFNSEEQKAILHYFLKLLQSILYYRVIGTDYLKLSSTDKERLLTHIFLPNLQINDIQKISKTVSEMIRQIDRYVSGRMVMFDGSLYISSLSSIRKAG